MKKTGTRVAPSQWAVGGHGACARVLPQCMWPPQINIRRLAPKSALKTKCCPPTPAGALKSASRYSERPTFAGSWTIANAMGPTCFAPGSASQSFQILGVKSMFDCISAHGVFIYSHTPHTTCDAQAAHACSVIAVTWWLKCVAFIKANDRVCLVRLTCRQYKDEEGCDSRRELHWPSGLRTLCMSWACSLPQIPPPDCPWST